MILGSILTAIAMPVVVGCIVAATAAANYKCKGCEFYVLITNADGTTTRVQWNGDPSTLPGPESQLKKKSAC